jgi:hypothetical protein
VVLALIIATGSSSGSLLFVAIDFRLEGGAANNAVFGLPETRGLDESAAYGYCAGEAAFGSEAGAEDSTAFVFEPGAGDSTAFGFEPGAGDSTAFGSEAGAEAFDSVPGASSTAPLSFAFLAAAAS